MTTTTAPKVQVLETWDDVIAFVLMTIFENKSDPESPITAEVGCEDMEGTCLIAETYKGSKLEEHKFFMPPEPHERVKLQTLLLWARGNTSKSFVTVSRTGHKLFWSVRLLPKR